jgi:hypothetical protein
MTVQDPWILEEDDSSFAMVVLVVRLDQQFLCLLKLAAAVEMTPD